MALLPDDLPAHGSADYVHLLVEGCKLAMADREAWYGDSATGILSAAADPRGMQGYAVGRWTAPHARAVGPSRPMVPSPAFRPSLTSAFGRPAAVSRGGRDWVEP